MTDAELMARAVEALVNYHKLGIEAVRHQISSEEAAQKLNIDHENFLEDFAAMSHTDTDEIRAEMAGYYMPGEGSLWVVKKAWLEDEDDLAYMIDLLDKQIQGFKVAILASPNKDQIGLKYDGDAPLAYQVFLVWAESEKGAKEKTMGARPAFQYYGNNYGTMDEIDEIVGYTLEKGPEPKKIFYVWTGGEYVLKG